MSGKHFFLYDFLLPLSGILFLGQVFSDRFDAIVFPWLDSIEAFGLGAWFMQSGWRGNLLAYSWLLYALVPAAAWMVWIRINVELDPVSGSHRLDRPIFTAFHRFFRWVEGGGEVLLLRQAYERRLAIEEDKVHRLEAELAGEFGSDGPFEPPPDSEEEWQDGYRPPAPQG